MSQCNNVIDAHWTFRSQLYLLHCVNHFVLKSVMAGRMSSIDSASNRTSGVTSEVILQEVQDLKLKIQQSGHISFLQEPEKQFWQELVDSNIRAGSLACLWCLKAQVNKRLSAAFNKWKLNTAIAAFQEKQQMTKDEKKAKPIQEALNVLSKYKGNDTSFLTRLAENEKMTTPDRIKSSSVAQITKQNGKPPISPVKERSPSSSAGISSLDLLQEETENFAKLSSTLVDKDIDPETKRRMLLTMSKNIVNKSQYLVNNPNNIAEAAPSSSHTNTPSASLLYPTPVAVASPLLQRESWNDYHSRSQFNNDRSNYPPNDNDHILSRTSLDLIHPQPSYQASPTTFTFEVPLNEHIVTKTSITIGNNHNSQSYNHSSSSNNSVQSRHSRRSQSSGHSRSSSHHGSHASHEELTQFLKFRRDKQGEYVRGILSPTPTRPSPLRASHSAGTANHDGNNDDRYAQVLAQATRHLQAAANQSKHPHDNNTSHSHSHNHGFPLHDYGSHNNNSQQKRSKSADTYRSPHSDDHSQYSTYSDLKSNHSTGQRSRSSSPSSIPGYLQVTRSSLKKSRAGSPPLRQFSPELLNPHNPHHNNSNTNRHSKDQSNHKSKNQHPHSHSNASSRSPSRNGHLQQQEHDDNNENKNHTNHHHHHPHHHHQDISVHPHHVETSATHDPKRKATLAPPRHASHKNTDDNNSVRNNADSFTSPTSHLYDPHHYPHLDNSPSIKAYLEASLKDFESRKGANTNNKSSNNSIASTHINNSIIAPTSKNSDDHLPFPQPEEYFGKSLLELSALDDEDPHHRSPHLEDLENRSHHSSNRHHHGDNHSSQTTGQQSREATVVSETASIASHKSSSVSSSSQPTMSSYRNPPNSYIASNSSNQSLASSSSHQSHHSSSRYHYDPDYPPHPNHHPNRQHNNRQQDNHSYYSSNHSVASVSSAHTLKSQHSQYTSNTAASSKRSHQNSYSNNSSSKGQQIEKAQWKLLFGDLQDVGKKDWERTLRR